MNCYFDKSPCEPITVPQFGHFHHCPSCGAFFRDPPTYLSPQAEKARYQLHHNHPEDPAYQAYFRRFIDQAILPYLDLTQPLTCLDFGSGPQPVLSSVMENHYHQKMAIYDPYFAPHSEVWNTHYDLITLVEVLEHLKRPLADLKPVVATLKVGGILALSTRLWTPDLGRFDNWWYIHDPTHVTFYSPQAITRLADHLGLRVLQIQPPAYITLQK